MATKMKIFKISLAMLICLATNINAQIKIQDNFSGLINTSSGFGIINGQMFDFNIGELVLTETYVGLPNFLFSQGFLQPYIISPFINVSNVVAINNVITPNGDGKNDVFLIDGLQNYPNNKLSIFDRSGRLVFTTVNYQSNWNGMLNGKKLNEDAYYYVIELGMGILPLRGSISIILDK
jgi:gliding motility-associated-like protein